MTSALGWQNNISLAGLTAGSAVLPLGNWQVDHGSPSTGWQTAAGVVTAAAGAWALIDGYTSKTWRAFLLARTNLTTGATVRWRVGPAECFIEAAPAWTVDATVTPAVTPAGLTNGRTTAAWGFNASGVLTSFASGVTRQIYDPITLARLGWLLESASTNVQRNARLEGAVAGTPGTMPTNCAEATGTGVSRQLVAAGVTEAGIPAVDFRQSGTASATGNIGMYLETSTGCAATVGQTVTLSVFVKLQAGSLTNINQVALAIQECNSSGTVLATQVVAITPTGSALAGQRYSFTCTLAQATAAFVRPYLRVSVSAGAVIDYTFRVGAPQVELAALASSPILPAVGTPAATTRAADSVSVPASVPASGWGLYADMTATTAAGATPALFGMAGASGFNGAQYVWAPSAVSIAPALQNGSGSSQWTSPVFARTNGGAVKVALSADVSSAAFAANANTASTSQALTLPSQTVIAVGGSPYASPAGALSGAIIILRTFKFYAQRLSNNQVTALAASGSSITAASLAYDSGTISAGVAAGYGQSLVIAPATASGRYCRVDITDSGNPDGHINVPLAYAGPVWLPAVAASYASQLGRDAQIDEVVTRNGQEFPTARWARRRWDTAWDGILPGELWANLMELDRVARRSGNVLFVPDTASATMQQEAIFGRLKATADAGWADKPGSRRTWRARITERI